MGQRPQHETSHKYLGSWSAWHAPTIVSSSLGDLGACTQPLQTSLRMPILLLRATGW